MPGPEAPRLRALAVRLREAGVAGDWDEVRRADAELQRWVDDLRCGAVPAVDAVVLREVAAAHDDVRRLARAAAASLGERLAELQTRHAAGHAYALQEALE